MNKWDAILQEELKKQPVNLYWFVEQCCSGFSVSAKQVIDHLLSLEDEQDIINGEISIETWKLNIEVWIKAGKPHYSGKQIG